MLNFTCAELNARVKWMWGATFESIKCNVCLSATETVEDLTYVRLLIQTLHFRCAELTTWILVNYYYITGNIDSEQS